MNQLTLRAGRMVRRAAAELAAAVLSAPLGVALGLAVLAVATRLELI